MVEPKRVFVIDTSSLIEFKRFLPATCQWGVLTRMNQMVTDGVLAFPPQVRREMKDVQFPDGPGIWAMGVAGWTVYGKPNDDNLAEVMGIAMLADPNSRTDPADPYVIALALQIQEEHPGCHPVVVSEDRVEHLPVKESMLIACRRLGLDFCGITEFVAEVFPEHLPPTPPPDVSDVSE